jgi:hypothetical protein
MKNSSPVSEIKVCKRNAVVPAGDGTHVTAHKKVGCQGRTQVTMRWRHAVDLVFSAVGGMVYPTRSNTPRAPGPNNIVSYLPR